MVFFGSAVYHDSMELAIPFNWQPNEVLTKSIRSCADQGLYRRILNRIGTIGFGRERPASSTRDIRSCWPGGSRPKEGRLFMKRRKIFNLLCPCGHRGFIVESSDNTVMPQWHFNFVCGLSHAGEYEGLDPLFADATPACLSCGQSLGPEHIVARTDEPVTREQSESMRSGERNGCFA